MHKPEKLPAAIIIDGAYLHECAKEHGKLVDMIALKKFIEAQCDTTFVECHYVTSLPKQIRTEYRQFISWLAMPAPKGPDMKVHPYSLRERHHKCRKCGDLESKYVQKGVDVAIAIKLIELATRYHHVAVLAGDADFAPAFKFIRTDPSRKLTLCTFGGRFSRELSAASNSVVFLDHHAGHFLRKTA